jgi:hypothetical protein
VQRRARLKHLRHTPEVIVAEAVKTEKSVELASHSGDLTLELRDHPSSRFEVRFGGDPRLGIGFSLETLAQPREFVDG